MEIKPIFTAPYYSRSNLELVLGSNRRTLDYRINALIKKGVLDRVRPGFYFNASLLSSTNENSSLLEYVGAVAKYPSYVSLEYALSMYGVIPESVLAITYVTSKKPGIYRGKNVTYRYRNMRSDLFNGFEKRKYGTATYLFAKKYKALFDFLYLTSTPTQNAQKELLFNSRINWEALTAEDLRSYVEVCAQSGSKKMANTVIMLQRENIL